MNIIILNNKEYILADELFNIIPTYSKESRNARELIKNKKIKDFIYGRKKNDKWIISDGSSNRYDKILIEKNFVDTIIDENKDDEIEIAPDIIILEDHEKFKDDEGKIIEIKVRGTRNEDDIYFRVKDVSIGFKMDRLYDVILDKTYKGYQEKIDYTFFNCYKNRGPDKNTYKKELYLTYEGILRVLFASQSKHVKTFRKWATKTLFVAQLGSQEEKEELASNLIGVNVKNVRQVFNLTKNETPGIYLINSRLFLASLQNVGIQENKSSANT